LLGEDDRAARARAWREARERVEFAKGVLEILSGSESMDFEDEESEILAANDLIAADELALRHASDRVLSAAEQGATDRRWAFGHVIVDEAQELSAMAWRMLMRRCPSRSMTIVGDVTQTGDPAGTDSWQRVLAPYVGDRWRLAELRVNYRTPAEVMTLAAQVLTEIDPTRRPPRSVRDTGIEPWRLSVGADELAERLAELAAAEAGGLGGGRMAVLVPASRLEHVGRAMRAAIPEAGVGADARLERAVVVLTVRQAKGLEFDSVLVADPRGILVESARGAGDLYVALTRTTQRLGIVHLGEVPAALAGARPRELSAGRPAGRRATRAEGGTDSAAEGGQDGGTDGRPDDLPNGLRILSKIY
jgi:DNA helicase IV